MDEIEALVEETYKHLQKQFPDGVEVSGDIIGMREDGAQEVMDIFPEDPGVIYHIQQTPTVFVIRTFVSRNIRIDYHRISEQPEEFPSLRLLEGGTRDELGHKLRFFLVGNPLQADIIHDQLNNRRFPVNEEMMCNLSDPGFSWWLTPKGTGFQISFTLSVSSGEGSLKLGPLGDHQMALKNFQALENLVSRAGLKLLMQNEMNRVNFSDGEEVLMNELRDLFEFGVITESMGEIFQALARATPDTSTLEMTWFYLQELAAMRRFWIQVQYDLTSST
ncbi:MAG TPA: hypothetical protein VNJ08_12530 [Bacteriovoracaceae bacterium]|nr:hypothetical protein [Bacteriovoracaceae bacterium]